MELNKFYNQIHGAMFDCGSIKRAKNIPVSIYLDGERYDIDMIQNMTSLFENIRNFKI